MNNTELTTSVDVALKNRADAVEQTIAATAQQIQQREQLLNHDRQQKIQVILAARRLKKEREQSLWVRRGIAFAGGYLFGLLVKNAGGGSANETGGTHGPSPTVPVSSYRPRRSVVPHPRVECNELLSPLSRALIEQTRRRFYRPRENARYIRRIR